MAMITRLSTRTPITLPTATDVSVLKPPLAVAVVEPFAVTLVPLLVAIGLSGIIGDVVGVVGLSPDELVGDPGTVTGGGADDEGTGGEGDGNVDLGGGASTEGGD